MATKLTILCQLNNGCMGCCGHDFVSKEKIKEAIKKNTFELNKLQPKTKQDFITFRDRYHPADLFYGVCHNLIEKEGKIFCPLHPALQGEDLREGHCEANYLCNTAKEFATWDEDKQNSFLEFVKQKNLENVDYSMKMDTDSLLKEFLEI